MRPRVVRPMMIGLLFLAAYCARADEAQPGAYDVSYSGGIGLDITRISYSTAGPRLDAPGDIPYLSGAWIQTIGGNIGMHVEIAKRLRLNTGFWANIWHPLQISRVGYTAVQTKRVSAGFSPGNYLGLYIGDLDRPLFDLSLGYFGINYGPDQKTFGGYLLNTAVYPGFVYSHGANAGLLGLRLHMGYFENHKHDLLITLEHQWPPFFDASFGYVGVVKPFDCLELGGGAMAYRYGVMPWNKGETRPLDDLSETDENLYVWRRDTVFTYDQNNVPQIQSIDSTLFKYSHAGIKAMVRFAFDFKRFIRSEKLGENDLRLYGEAAVLGFKDYRSSRKDTEPLDVNEHKGYEDITQRIPVMLGFTPPRHPIFTYGVLPAAMSVALIAVEDDRVWYDTAMVAVNDTFPCPDDLTQWCDSTRLEPDLGNIDTNVVKRGFEYRKWRPYAWVAGSVIAGVGTFLLEKYLGKPLRLDRLALEVEWYGTPYRLNPYGDRSPLPRIFHDEQGVAGGGHDDDWRWSVTAGKTLFERLSISAKIASDHLRTIDENGWYEANERLYASNEWYWSLNVDLGF